MPIHFKLAKKDRKKIGHGNTTFSAIFVICKILSDKTQLQTLMTNISTLIEEYGHVDISQLGFPENWGSVLAGIIK